MCIFRTQFQFNLNWINPMTFYCQKLKRFLLICMSPFYNTHPSISNSGSCLSIQFELKKSDDFLKSKGFSYLTPTYQSSRLDPVCHRTINVLFLTFCQDQNSGHWRRQENEILCFSLESEGGMMVYRWFPEYNPCVLISGKQGANQTQGRGEEEEGEAGEQDELLEQRQ